MFFIYITPLYNCCSLIDSPNYLAMGDLVSKVLETTWNLIIHYDGAPVEVEEFTKEKPEETVCHTGNSETLEIKSPLVKVFQWSMWRDSQCDTYVRDEPS